MLKTANKYKSRPSIPRYVQRDHKTVSRYKPDYYTREVKEWHWITYPWAVMEDMTAFIKEMRPAPTSAEQVAQKLRSEHNIEAPTQILLDAFKLSGLK